MSNSLERMLTPLQTLVGANKTSQGVSENEAFIRNMAAQEQVRRAALEQNGQLIDASELAARLGVTTLAVGKALKAGSLFALDGSGMRLLYPAFYADGKIPQGELETITRALGDIPSSSKWQFFTNPKGSLNGETPLQALQRGDHHSVMVTLAGFLQR